MAMGKHSQVDGRKSSKNCSKFSIVAFVAFSFIGVSMLMRSTIPKNSDLSSGVVNDVKHIISDNDDENIVRNNYNENQQEMILKEGPKEKIKSEKESHNTVEKNQQEQFEKEIAYGNTESGKETKLVSKFDIEGKREDEESRSGGEEPNPKVGEKEILGGEEDKNKNTETDQKSGENKSNSSNNEIKVKSEENANKVNLENKMVDEEKIAQNMDKSELPRENTNKNEVSLTQKVESQNENKSQRPLISKEQTEHVWRLCNTTAGPDYIPCLDNWKVIRRLPSVKHYEHRERHCPDEASSCLVPLPRRYKRRINWPESRDRIWFYNTPYTKLWKVKGHQNWVNVSGEYLTFPGGGTQFRNGALHYIDFIQKSLPKIAWGKRSRVVLDVGCGVASFGGYLFERDVLTMSFAPKDEHEAQVQFALERGIPAILSVMGTKRLPFPGSVYDLVHCARCRVPWHVENGRLLLELNRVLRPGGYFVWSATPVYQKLSEDVGIWKAMSRLTKSMCWDLVVLKKDRLNGVGAAIYRKPTTNECYNQRSQKEPPLCEEPDDPNIAWNVSLQACMHKVPVDASKHGSRWPEQWPLRLEKPPKWLDFQAGVNGKAAAEDFTADYEHWKNVISKSYLDGMGIRWSSLRNVMDMRAVYGGFAAALKNLKVWVMNVVPIESPDTLPLIFERGLIGIYHDWCESFNTYPRSYDLLHANHLFSSLNKRCNIVAVIAEVDRILRPEGNLIIRDDPGTIGELENLCKSLKWEVRLVYSNDEEGLLCIQKTLWRPIANENIVSAIV